MTVLGTKLRTGQTRSCGCLSRDLAAERLRLRNTMHGLSRHPQYKVWANMRNRCNNPNAHNWARYGGRGIEVCERWDGPHCFPNYFADMGERPAPGMQLDRIDNDGDYEPSNMQWLTHAEHVRKHHSVST